MPRYRFSAEHTAVLPATLDDVWGYIDDRQAQVDFDPRMIRIEVIEGAWGEPGCRAVATARLATGQVHTFEQRIEAVDRPRSFATSSPFPEGVTRGVQSFSEVDGGVEWTHRVEVETRRVSMLELLALTLTARSRRREVAADHRADRAAFEAALAARRG